MKKTMAFILALCLCVGLCACGDQVDNSRVDDNEVDHGELITHGECDDNIKWELYEDGFLDITGKGKMKETPWLDYAEYIRCVEIDDGVLAIAQGAFRDCTDIVSVTINDRITEIPDKAFAGCSSLERITLPSGITFIGDSAFSDCSSPQRIELSDCLTVISDFAFSDCSSLESIILPDSLTSIGEFAFCKCISLESVRIPTNVTIIQRNTFYECDSLNCVAILGEVTEIKEKAFCGCNIREIYLPVSISTIYPNAFLNNYSVDTVYYAGDSMPHINYPYKRLGSWKYDRTCDLYEFFPKAEIIFNTKYPG